MIFVFLCLSETDAVYAQTVTRSYGVASYYADYFHGRSTASGEIFSQDSMTAAHLTLPFGTLVKVVNLNNNKSVILKVNDRGPFVEGRIIDLSRAAAEKLDFLAQGLVNVSVEVVGFVSIKKAEQVLVSSGKKQTADNKIADKPLQKAEFKDSVVIKPVRGNEDTAAIYSLQVGSFTVKSNAELVLEKLQKLSPDAFIKEVTINGKTFFRVLTGKKLSKTEAEQNKKMLRRDFPSAFIVKFED